MPKGKKGFSIGAEHHRYRSRARDGPATSREAAGAAVQQIGQLMADGTYSAAEGLRQVRTLLEREEGIADAGAEATAGDEGGSAKRLSGLAMVTARLQDLPGRAVHCPRVGCCCTTRKQSLWTVRASMLRLVPRVGAFLADCVRAFAVTLCVRTCNSIM